MSLPPAGRLTAALAAALVGSVAGPTPAPAQELLEHFADLDASSVWVVTRKSGLLSFLGHEHAIVPMEWRAQLCLSRAAPTRGHGALVVSTASLVIDSDSARTLAGLGGGPGEGDVRAIQAKLLDAERLAAEAYPEIVLELSSHGDSAGAPEARPLPAPGPSAGEEVLPVGGSLSLRGVSRPVAVRVAVRLGPAGGRRLRGMLRVRQSDFGISPETVAAVVKVSDAVELHFDLVALPTGRLCEAPAGAGRG